MSDRNGMARMRLMGTAVAAASCVLLFTGCASQKKLDDSREAQRAYDQRVFELEQELDAESARADEALAALDECSGALNARDAAIAALRTDVERFQSETQRAWDRLSEFDPMILPQDADEALRELAAQYPDLLQYDDRHGMIRFASDLTFDLGSDVVRSEAAEALNVIGDVLNSPELSDFEVQIVGHTDNVPIGKPATRAKHPTNRHLSVHRAISVERVLAKAGVDPHRMKVAGWGELRPIVANPAKGGAAQNRRVELFIRPMPKDQQYIQQAEAAEPTTDSAVNVMETDDSEPLK